MDGPEVVVAPVETLLNARSAAAPTTSDDVHQVPTASSEKLTAEQQHELITAYRNGATLVQLGQRLGLDRKTVSRFLHRQNVRVRRQNLTADQLTLAVKLHRQGWSSPRIATELGVNTDTVHRRIRDHNPTPDRPDGGALPKGDEPQ